MTVTSIPFGSTKSGESITCFQIQNKHGMSVSILNYGATIQSILIPDRNGKVEDVVLGFDSIHGYESQLNPYFGATCGRYANRISNGRFTLKQKVVELATNDGSNSLHGGIKGFDKCLWQAEIVNDTKVSMKLSSSDGDEGYPGNLCVSVTFALGSDKDDDKEKTNKLRIDYRATTDQTTVINLTNHTYFNLSSTGSVQNHKVQIMANRYCVVDDAAIPTGELREVEKNLEMDLRSPVTIGDNIDQVQGLGYDHNYCLNKSNDGDESGLIVAAKVWEPNSGRLLTCLTTEPGVQFYTGNYLDGIPGKKGIVYQNQSGFCLETQHFPDSPNQPSFPTTQLDPGEEYIHTCIYRFDTKEAFP